MFAAVIGKMEIGGAQDGTQRDMYDLKIVLRRLRNRNLREGIEIVHQQEIAVEMTVDRRRKQGERFRQAAADHQEARVRCRRNLQVSRCAITSAIVSREEFRLDTDRFGRFGGFRLSLCFHKTCASAVAIEALCRNICWTAEKTC